MIRSLFVPLLLLATSAAADPAPSTRILYGAATEYVSLDGSPLSYGLAFDVERRFVSDASGAREQVRFGNARAPAQGVASLDQGGPHWSSLVGWLQDDPSRGPQVDVADVGRAIARWKRQLGPQTATDDATFEQNLSMLAQVESAARWRSWVGLWQPVAERDGWWVNLGGGARPDIGEERLAGGALRRTARYSILGAQPPVAVPLGAPFWQVLDAKVPNHPLFDVESGIDVAVVETAEFAPGADWPRRVVVERRVGPDAQGRSWTVRQELQLDWRAADAPPPPLADESPWIEHAAPATGAGGDREPYYRYTRAPVYPEISRAARFSGSVTLSVRLDADGVPVEVSVKTTTGVPDLDDAAVAAVREWRFWPKLRGGVAVPAEVAVPVSFRLPEADSGDAGSG